VCEQMHPRPESTLVQKIENRKGCRPPGVVVSTYSAVPRPIQPKSAGRLTASGLSFWACDFAYAVPIGVRAFLDGFALGGIMPARRPGAPRNTFFLQHDEER
jgi:hypothetical protein